MSAKINFYDTKELNSTTTSTNTTSTLAYLDLLHLSMYILWLRGDGFPHHIRELSMSLGDPWQDDVARVLPLLLLTNQALERLVVVSGLVAQSGVAVVGISQLISDDVGVWRLSERAVELGWERRRAVFRECLLECL